MGKSEPQLVMIGVIVRAHGLRGAVKVRVTADEVESFSAGRKVQLQRGSERLGEYAIENLQKGHDGLFVKFRSVNDREEAERLRGAQIMLAREEFLQRAPGQFFYFEIIGLPVYSDTGQTLGEIVDILRYPANDVWVIRDGGEEKLIPAIDAVIQKVDLQNRRVIIVPIPGLLEDGQ